MSSDEKQEIMIYVPKPDRDRFFSWWEKVMGSLPTKKEWEDYRDKMIQMRKDFPNAYDDLGEMVDKAVAGTFETPRKYGVVLDDGDGDGDTRDNAGDGVNDTRKTEPNRKRD